MIFLSTWCRKNLRTYPKSKEVALHMSAIIAYHNLYARQVAVGREIKKGTGT